MRSAKEILKKFKEANLPSQEEVMACWPARFDKPKVSIRCLAYNHEKFIEDALKGFLIQKTTFPFEILIHDDASTDDTAKILREYEEKYPLIIKVVYQTENQYSQGIKPIRYLHEITQGEYIAACEGDDFWTDPNKLAIQVKYLDENPKVLICYHNASIIDFESKNIIRGNQLRREHCRNYTADDLIRAVAHLPTLTWMFRNIDYPKIKFSNLSRNGDRIRLVSIGLKGGEAHYLSNITNSFYRKHENGVWSGIESSEKLFNQIYTYSVLSLNFKSMGQTINSKYYLKLILERQLELTSFYELLFLYVKVLKKRVKIRLKFFMRKR